MRILLCLVLACSALSTQPLSRSAAQPLSRSLISFRGSAHQPLSPSALRLRGGKELGGGHHQDNAGLQLPLLRNILDFSTSLTNVSAHNASDNQTLSPLDPERAAWLQEAMKGLIENTTDVFRNSIENLHLSEDREGDVKIKEEALCNLAERVESLDLADGLHNMGGFKPVVECLSSVHAQLRLRAADVVALCVQNHPTMQQVALRFGALPKLATMYSNRTEGEAARGKALHAISALIRGNSTHELWFIYNGGLANLRVDIQIGEVRIRKKAMFVLSQLLKSNQILRAAVLQIEEGKEFQGKGVMPEIIQNLGFPDPQVSEFVVEVLTALLEYQPSTKLKNIRKQFPALLGNLERRLTKLKKEEDSNSEVFATANLIAILKGTTRPSAPHLSDPHAPILPERSATENGLEGSKDQGSAEAEAADEAEAKEGSEVLMLGAPAPSDPSGTEGANT